MEHGSWNSGFPFSVPCLVSLIRKRTLECGNVELEFRDKPKGKPLTPAAVVRGR